MSINKKSVGVVEGTCQELVRTPYGARVIMGSV